MHKEQKKDIGWVLSANFAEGLPYAVITTLSVVMMQDLGLSNAEVTAWTSLLAMPWSFKAIWSPLVGRTCSAMPAQGGLKLWMWVTQLLLAVCIAGVALSLLSAHWLVWCLVSLAVGAFASATYDVACDGFYMHALSEEAQSFFVGIRSTAYRLSMIFASGFLTSLVGLLVRRGVSDIEGAWVQVLGGVAVLMVLLSVFHRYVLPDKTIVSRAENNPQTNTFIEWRNAFSTFVRKPGLWFILSFLLFYRLGEAMLSKMSILFLKAPVSEGGLGLDNAEYGLLYGTIGVGALTVGGILGGIIVSRYGLRRCVIPLALALNVPDLLYVWMSVAQPSNRWLIGSLVGIEQFGYGLGFTAYMVFMLQSSQGRHSTSHYAILTALMAIGMNIPSMLSGWLQEALGYMQFFWFSVACTLPGMLLTIKLYKNKI